MLIRDNSRGRKSYFLNKANASDTEAPFLDLHLSISNGFVSSKFYDKRDDFDFDIVNYFFFLLDGVYICQLIRFARVSSHVTDFNARKTMRTKHFESLQKLRARVWIQ